MVLLFNTICFLYLNKVLLLSSDISPSRIDRVAKGLCLTRDKGKNQTAMCKNSKKENCDT